MPLAFTQEDFLVYCLIPFGVTLHFSVKFKVFLQCALSDWNSPPLPSSDTSQWIKFLVRYVSRNKKR